MDLEEPAKQKDLQGNLEGHLRQNDAPVAVQEAEPADLEVQRQDGNREGKQQPQEKIVVQGAVQSEAQPGQGERGGGADQQLEQHGKPCHQ